MLLRPCPRVEPTATPPAVAAIWEKRPGWLFDWVGAGALGAWEFTAAGGAAMVEAERVCAGAFAIEIMKLG